MIDYAFAARIILGTYLTITGGLKLPDLKGFVTLVKTYGGMAAKYPVLAYLIPFSELIIGIALLASFYLLVTTAAALVMCMVYTYGVAKALINKQKMENCGCFGTLIKIPLTKWSLVEDIICVALATFILLGTLGML